MRYLRLFFSDAPYAWFGDPVLLRPGMPVPMRWFARVVVLGAIALLFYHLLAGSL